MDFTNQLDVITFMTSGFLQYVHVEKSIFGVCVNHTKLKF